MSPIVPVKRMIYEEETEMLIGICLTVQQELGCGFSEIVYKDALQIEFAQRNIRFEREKKYVIEYKSIILPHYFFADFIVLDKIILEIKGKSEISKEDYNQTINYLKCSGCKIGLIVNFGASRLGIKRIIL